jgi:signal transduction histidine kinase
MPVRGKGMTVIAVPMIALIVSTSASLVLQHDESHERNVGRSAGALVTAADQVLADAINAETGVRGYLAARDPLFLAPYDLTLTRMSAERRTLRTAAVAEGDGALQSVVDTNTGTVMRELAQLRRVVKRGVGALRSRLEHEKSTMDLLRRQVAVLVDRPAAEQIVQRGRISRLQAVIGRTDLAALVLGLLAGLVGIALFTSGVSRRVATNAANADLLGQGRPLEPVVWSADEIGRVAMSHQRAKELLDRRAVELTDARDEALQATRAKTSFLTSTSHELRTPLNVILGFTQVLEMSDLSSADRENAGRILLAGRHLLALINGLIDIARIESGDLRLSPESVAVLPLIDEVTKLMGPLAAERGISLTYDCQPVALALLADRQRLVQILVNLISNATKYNRRDGTILIVGRAVDDERVTVVVSDTGRGLTAAELERAFVPFERLGAEDSGAEGTGIGLPLARALTEAMGGRLEASSVLGRGSAFTVSLPIAAGTVLVPSAQVDVPAQPLR